MTHQCQMPVMDTAHGWDKGNFLPLILPCPDEAADILLVSDQFHHLALSELDLALSWAIDASWKRC